MIALRDQPRNPRPNLFLFPCLLLFAAAAAVTTTTPANAQTCQTAADMDAPSLTALETTANRYFEMAVHGDAPALKQNAIPSVAASFAGIESAVREDQRAFTDAKAIPRPPFLLDAEGSSPVPHAEFLCGVFGKNGQTKDSAVFVLNNLPPGKYGVVILDVRSAQASKTLTLILQQAGTDWKLAGFFPRPTHAAGHDALWFAERARDFKKKMQNHNAWLYYREAIYLSSPVDIMSTLVTDKLYDEAQTVEPTDVPENGNTIDLTGGATVFHVTEIFPLALAADLDVGVKYQAADVSNTAKAFQENTAVIKALVSKFPEFRDAFAGVEARAVDPSGHDYGSLLPMKEIK